MAMSKVWNPGAKTRLGIALFAAVYLVVTHPWALDGRSLARNHYQVVLAFLMMAAFPRGTKLYVALGVTFAVLFLMGLAINGMALA